MKFINIKDDSPKENKDYFVKVHPGTDDEYLDVFYWGGEYFSKRGIYFDLPMAFLDEQDEGWVPVVGNNYPIDISIIIEHEYGYDAVRLDKEGWKFWYAGDLVPKEFMADILKTAKRYLIANKSQPPATKD